MPDTKLAAELSKLRFDVENLHEDVLANALPAEVLAKFEDVLSRLAELTAAAREAGL